MKMTFKNLFKVLGLDKVDWKKATTRLLVVLWGVLICCFLIKIFGGNLFEIMTNNENYIRMCNFLSQEPYVLMMPFPFYILSTYFAVLIISRDKPKNNHYIYFIILFLMYILKLFNEYLGLIAEILLYFITSLIYSKRIWRGIETYIIMFLFQFISLITRNIGFTIENDDVFTNMIFFIDYYIMMSIYCINTIIRKEGIIMGLWGPILLSKKEKQLYAYREKLVSKKIKLDSRIKEIDRAIENEKVK